MVEGRVFGRYHFVCNLRQPISPQVTTVASAACRTVYAILVQLPPSFSNHTWSLLFAGTEYAEAAQRFPSHVHSAVTHRSMPSQDDFWNLLHELFAGKQTVSQFKATAMRVSISLPWIHCGAKTARDPVHTVNGEMMACGRVSFRSLFFGLCFSSSTRRQPFSS